MKKQELFIKAPAKINLSLLLTGRRADGYHLISSVMQLVSLYDTITIQKRTASGIEIITESPLIPCGEKNTCYKAAASYFKTAGIDNAGISINIKKMIPESAGLAGGSSDAAAVIKGLERIYGAFEGDHRKLNEIALSIGADVPFCMNYLSSCCICEGIGEIMTPVSRNKQMTKIYAVIAKKTRGLSTPSVYARYDALNKPATSERDAKLHAEMLAHAVSEGEPRDIAALLKNELYEAAICIKPEIACLIGSMMSLGALGASMSGSGSAVFGIFPNIKTAKQCESILRADRITAYCVRFI
ncbi:MAG: 4-(cytidine 5'-diphospho)-2-C-methyl-D-erythritol kinase [Oscillospiraceae bacterium]|nr:4-(cytidine 5'-diphospho)-2-C-methyl-D-erythritol kinase [Oscillospiraceae bacterium]